MTDFDPVLLRLIFEDGSKKRTTAMFRITAKRLCRYQFAVGTPWDGKRVARALIVPLSQ